MSYKGKKINELPIDPGVEKLLGTDVNGEVKLIGKEDVGGDISDLETDDKSSLVAAINELVTKNTALEARVAALEGGGT